MNTPTQEQWLSIGRHVAGYAGGAVSMFAALHLINAGDADKAATALTQISTGFSSIIGGIGTLMGIGATVYGFLTAGPLSMFFKGAKAVAADPQVVQQATVTEQASIATAAQALPEIKAVLATPEVAMASPSPNVVSSTARIAS